MNIPQRTTLSILIAQACCAPVWAQQAAATDNAAETIVIQAQRSNASVARKVQEQAPNLVNVTTAEEMRKLPDVNTAEAVRRIPGISLETDTGEGRYINIRGIDADLNSTTFGGLRLPPSNNASPFGGGRAVALDAIPTGLVGAITVTKTTLPEQDAEALGGTIEITPKTAPRGAGAFIDARLGTGYESLRSTGIGDISVTGGTRFGGRTVAPGAIEAYGDRPFSLVLTGTYYEDRRGVDDVEPAFIDGGNFPAPSTALAGWDQRYYQYHRQRHGLGIDLGFQPSADSSYYLRFFDAGYTETVHRNRLTVTPDGNPTYAGGTYTDGMTVNGFDKTLRDEKERIGNQVFAVGGKNRIGAAQLDYRLGYTEGSYKKLYDYNSDFNYTPASGTISYNESGQGHTPLYTISGADFLNPANYTLAKFQNSTTDITDKELSTAENLRMPVNWGGFDAESLKVGISGRWRKRHAATQPYSYSGAPALALAPYLSGGNVNFYAGQYNNMPNIADGELQTVLAPYQTISAGDAINAALQTQIGKEDVYAAYGQYELVSGRLTVTGGARVEATRARYDGYGEGGANTASPFVLPVSATHNYTNFFPSLQARFELEPRTLLRAVWSTAIARPGFNQVTPSLVVDPAANQITQGNPNLKPITDNAFDFSFEHYLPSAGIVSIGLFDKQFNNYIVGSQSDQVPPSGGLYAGFVGTAHVISFANVSQAWARGLEFNYEQKLPHLPPALRGLGVGLNYTLVASNFAIRPGESSTLPSTSKNTLNFYLSYQRRGWDLRLGGYYLSRNLWAIGGASGLDVYSEPRFSLDFGSSYKISPHASVYFSAKNLTNTPLTFAEGASNRVIQREFYRQTYQVGATFSY
ncbi:MAG: TonB-dependent receptor [Burkholderiales bacterium]|nr:TonB-dependent receptor [Burkholderiales bacterium]MDE1926586.1 TonB-dependent receptor [Burkholderiales bacterium]MDE2501387.1 TonB-dependent receptor [Burkholderiales bacterium]